MTEIFDLSDCEKVTLLYEKGQRTLLLLLYQSLHLNSILELEEVGHPWGRVQAPLPNRQAWAPSAREASTPAHWLP